MKNKIENWLEKHEFVYGCGLLIVSLCTVAFGFARLGENTTTTNNTTIVNIYCSDDVDALTTE